MSVKRMTAAEQLPTRQPSAPVNALPEYADTIRELAKGLRAGERLEVIVKKESVSKMKLKRPAMSLVHALRRYIVANELTHRVMQRQVNGEPWPRVYVEGGESNERSSKKR